MRSRYQIALKKARTVHECGCAMRHTSALQQGLRFSTPIGSAARTVALFRGDNLQHHLGDKVVALFAERRKYRRERARHMRRNERHIGRCLADSNMRGNMNANAPQRFNERMSSITQGIFNAPAIRNNGHVERHRAVELQHECSILHALICDDIGRRVSRCCDLIVDFEMRRRIDVHNRWSARCCSWHHAQLVGVFVDGHRRHGRAKWRHLIRLLIERRRQNLVVEVAAIDDNFVHMPHATFSKIFSELDQIEMREQRVAEAFQIEAARNVVSVNPPVDASEHVKVTRQIGERSCCRNKLHIGSRIECSVSVEPKNFATTCDIDHRHANAITEIRGSSERTQSIRELSFGGRRGKGAGVSGLLCERTRLLETNHACDARENLFPRTHGANAITSFLACALLVFFTLAGCSQPSQAPAHKSANDPLVVLLPDEVQELDPRFVSDAYGLKISRLLFASLVTTDPQTLEVVPDLAEKIQLVSPTTYRVTLRPNLTFSNGEPLDANDVAATYQSILDPAFGSRFRGSYAARIEEIKVEDATHLVFVLKAPHAPFMTDLEMPILREADAHTHLGHAGDAAPIGAGPFRLVSRTPGKIELVENDRWHRGKTRFHALQFLVVHDDNTRALRLLGDAADVALNAIPPMLVPLFHDASRYSVQTAEGIGTTYVGFNMDDKTLRDPRVRKAIALAIDRQTLIAAKFGGRARTATSFIPPGHWAHDNNLPEIPFDPAAARALLDEAGFADPQGDAPRLHLTLRTSTDRFRQSVARAIAAMLANVGIDVDVRPSELATLIADLNAGHFQMTTLQLPELIEPHVLSSFFASDRIPGKGREGVNRWRYRNFDLDAALEEGRTATSLEARRNAYVRAQQMLATDLPVIPLWHEDVVAITSARAREIEIPRDARFSTLARGFTAQ